MLPTQSRMLSTRAFAHQGERIPFGNVFVTGYSIPPSLTIARTTMNTVAVSWPSPSTGFTFAAKHQRHHDRKVEQRRCHTLG